MCSMLSIYVPLAPLCLSFSLPACLLRFLFLHFHFNMLFPSSLSLFVSPLLLFVLTDGRGVAKSRTRFDIVWQPGSQAAPVSAPVPAPCQLGQPVERLCLLPAPN